MNDQIQVNLVAQTALYSLRVGFGNISGTQMNFVVVKSPVTTTVQGPT